MSPVYAIRWWKERQFTPPDIDPIEFLIRRLNWRYAMGRPASDARGKVYLGDSLSRLRALGGRPNTLSRKVSLLFTSPPCLEVTNYHYDQWLRLWMLGGPPHARRVHGIYRGNLSIVSDTESFSMASSRVLLEL